MSTVALAADFPPALPPLVQPAVESGWYLRRCRHRQPADQELVATAGRHRLQQGGTRSDSSPFSSQASAIR
jgi:hypothetical protein